ncbi:hypothetical protein [Lichenibacterium dinghuense]|nr:hypothetical protein [Lichenibacterium sp. 6Y81]
MTRALVLLAYAYRLRRARRLLARGRHAEARRVLHALDREHRIP